MKKFIFACRSFYPEFLIMSSIFFLFLALSFLLFSGLYLTTYTRKLDVNYYGVKNIHDKVFYHAGEP